MNCSREPGTGRSGAAIVPLIVEVAISAAGPLRNVQWCPGPELNLVLAPPGSGATSLWGAIAGRGRCVDVEFTPYAISVGAFAIPAGIRALATVSAAIIAASPRYCAVVDTDLTAALDAEALLDFTRLLVSFAGQTIVFCTPSVFERLGPLIAERWQLVREIDGTLLKRWPGGTPAQ